MRYRRIVSAQNDFNNLVVYFKDNGTLRKFVTARFCFTTDHGAGEVIDIEKKLSTIHTVPAGLGWSKGSIGSQDFPELPGGGSRLNSVRYTLSAQGVVRFGAHEISLASGTLSPNIIKHTPVDCPSSSVSSESVTVQGGGFCIAPGGGPAP